MHPLKLCGMSGSNNKIHQEGKRRHRIVRSLERSALYQDYERAFGKATGLPLRLAASETWQLESHDRQRPNPFYDLIAHHHQTCAACLDLWQGVANSMGPGPRTFTCFSGLCESSVAVRIGENTIGFLRTGEVTMQQPSSQRFQKIVRHLMAESTEFDKETITRAYFASRVMDAVKYHAILDLLAVFAKHLSLLADQIILRDECRETPNISRARRFILDHKDEPLELKRVAGVANMSSCYFCRKFKEATGFTFTEYVSRIRIEAAKTLLLDSRVSISEIAFEAGFQSITHFNRSFRQIMGQSPGKYRDELRKAGTH